MIAVIKYILKNSRDYNSFYKLSQLKHFKNQIYLKCHKILATSNRSAQKYILKQPWSLENKSM